MFSPEQHAAIAAIVKSAVSELTAQLSCAAAEPNAPAGAPAVESGVATLGGGDATKSRDAATLPHISGEADEYVPDLGVDNPHARAV